MFEVCGVSRHYAVKGAPPSGRAVLRALDGVTLSTGTGETLAIVGESGCGKSTLARLLLRLERPSSGTLRFRGVDLWKMDRAQVREFRRRVQLIFQDPYASLNPRMRVGEIVGEPLAVHGLGSSLERRERVAELLDQVGLGPEAAARYPHQFSGGQRQRIGIARALAAGPEVVVADEPVSALDVSIQAQILNLLKELHERRGFTCVFISHDLRVVRFMADRVAVMYLGRIVEWASADQLFEAPMHPYTAMLLASVPMADPSRRNHPPPPPGEMPSPTAPPPGCPFHPRCPSASAGCRTERPELQAQAGGRAVACHLYARGA